MGVGGELTVHLRDAVESPQWKKELKPLDFEVKDGKRDSETRGTHGFHGGNPTLMPELGSSNGKMTGRQRRHLPGVISTAEGEGLFSASLTERTVRSTTD